MSSTGRELLTQAETCEHASTRRQAEGPGSLCVPPELAALLPPVARTKGRAAGGTPQSTAPCTLRPEKGGGPCLCRAPGAAPSPKKRRARNARNPTWRNTQSPKRCSSASVPGSSAHTTAPCALHRNDAAPCALHAALRHMHLPSGKVAQSVGQEGLTHSPKCACP
jgi:hypothetical protein